MHLRKAARVTLAMTIIAAMILIPGCGNSQSSPDVTIDTDIEKNSYAIGVNFYSQLQSSYVDVDPQALARGIEDAMAGDLQMNENEVSQTLQQLQMKAEQRYQEEISGNLSIATDFIVKNAAKDGIVTLPDSLQYEVMTEGSGDMPKMGDTVRVHYTGTLIDGTVFDSSVQRGEPAEFMLGQVIPGWNEALTLMPVGSKWRLFIPPQLAYGSSSPSPAIPPNALLIFEVELLDIVASAE